REGSDGSALVPLHEQGILGALFPEVARLRARAQHSLYHVYTVDTHTVFALAQMMRLRSGALAETEPVLTRVARAQQRPLVLMLGLLFHDHGKGMGPDHSSRGAELVRSYAQRIALDPADARDVEWLVLAHLRMSHISQRRDLEDVNLIESFAREVGTPARLEMLYLLTYADMSCVSPENWTPWKANLLGAEVNSLSSGVALDTFVVRESGGGAPSQTRWEAARADLLRLLSGAEDPHRLVQKRLRRAPWASSATPSVETKLRVDDVSSEN